MQFSLYMTFMGTPWHKTPQPGVNETYTLSRLVIGHHYNILSLSDQCLGLEKKIFKKKMQFPNKIYRVTR